MYFLLCGNKPQPAGGAKEAFQIILMNYKIDNHSKILHRNSRNFENNSQGRTDESESFVKCF